MLHLDICKKLIVTHVSDKKHELQVRIVFVDYFVIASFENYICAT